MATIIETANELLRFWFGEQYLKDGSLKNDIPYIKSRFQVWFNQSSPSFDQFQINNSELFDRTDNNVDIFNFDSDWNQPKGLLAKIILYDQFPRSIYRSTDRAFKYDILAISYALKIIKEGLFFTEYSAIERLFIVTCFSHSEDIVMQEIAVEFGLKIAQGENSEIKAFFDNLEGFPHQHYEVVKKFNRFPSRNEALGRETTEEEALWLASPECPPWAKSQMKKLISEPKNY